MGFNQPVDSGSSLIVSSAMEITTRTQVKKINATDAQLIIHLFVNGEIAGNVVYLSGPHKDVEAFAKSEIDVEEVRRRWFKPASV